MSTITIGVFAMSTPLLLGVDTGVFSRAGLDVEFERVPSSTVQFERLAAGDYPLIQTSIDNVAHYRVNPSAATGSTLPVEALFGTDSGLNLTIAARSASSLAELRGRTVSVDSPVSGFAFVLYGLLESVGLTRDDYAVTSHGGVRDRYLRLLEDDTDAEATLLSSGFEDLAGRAGLYLLATSSDVADPYLGAVFAALESRDPASTELADRFRTAYEVCLAMTFDGKHDDRAIELLAESRRVAADVAAAMLAGERGPLGLTRSVSIDPEAVLNVLRLRQQFGGFTGDVDIEALARPGSPLYAAGTRLTPARGEAAS